SRSGPPIACRRRATGRASASAARRASRPPPRQAPPWRAPPTATSPAGSGGAAPYPTSHRTGASAARPRGAPRPSRRAGVPRRLRASRQVLRSEQREQAKLATVVVGPGCSDRHAHHLRGVLHRHLMKEHEIEHLALASRQRPQRTADPSASLLGEDRLARIRRGAAEKNPPRLVGLQPPPPPRTGGD